MELFYRELGSGEPLVILHGLYGSSDNWMSIGRLLSEKYRVILVDQRNHGQSPHSPNHSYADMVADLYELFIKLNLTDAILLGHSMGGKTAALFAYSNPHLLKGLVVADIIPFPISGSSHLDTELISMHRRIMSGLLSLNIESAKSRDDLDAALSVSVSNRMVRQFLLKSVKRNEDGSFVWMLNIEVLSQHMEKLMAPSLPQSVDKPIAVKTQLIKGEKSSYMSSEGMQEVDRYFSNYRLDVIGNAGHWLHAENPKGFIDALSSFLESLSD